MLSSCRISGGAASGSISNRPIASICWIRSWSASLILPRHGREGVDRPHCLSAHGQDRRAVSGAIVAEIRWSNPCATIPAAWRYSPLSISPRSALLNLGWLLRRSGMSDLHEAHDLEREPGIDTVRWLFLPLL